MTVTPSRMQQRRRTAAQWAAENPTLAAAEIGVATGGAVPEMKIGDDSTAWTSLFGPSLRHRMIFWLHGTAVTIPNNVWTPFPFNTLTTTRGTDWTSYVAASTTIAAGSNGQALPQSTINVASTTGFATSGYLVITIGGTHRVVKYTGTTATTFTGCTLGVGTMTTGDAVAQANVEWIMPANTVGPAVAEMAFASNATGIRGIRFFFAGSFPLPGATTVIPAATAASPLLHIQSSEQPAWTGAADRLRIEVFQNSGGNLDTGVEAISAPRLVVIAASAF